MQSAQTRFCHTLGFSSFKFLLCVHSRAPLIMQSSRRPSRWGTWGDVHRYSGSSETVTTGCTYCYGDHGAVGEGCHHHLLQDALLREGDRDMVILAHFVFIALITSQYQSSAASLMILFSQLELWRCMQPSYQKYKRNCPLAK